jgi:methylmalonyl-CoA/ethylmalonyl-CoA epimerase
MPKPHVDHIGIIVADLEKSVALFERLWGIKPSGIKEMPEVGLKIAQIETANIEIELLQYTGEGESFAKQVMGTKTGMNHISFRVADTRQKAKDFEGKGLQVKAGFPRQGAHGRVAFFEPETTEGLLMEICSP